MPIQPSTLQFLKDLKHNNDRDWFQANRDRYEAAHQDMVAFSEELMNRMSHYDQIQLTSGKKALFRIYRDTRFSKDKTPYKPHLAGFMKRATKLLRGGYYFHIEPGNTFLGGGFWNPNPDDLKRIREELAADPRPMRAITADPQFQELFGGLMGDEVKTAPRGFTVDHPAIDLIRKKQFLVMRKFPDKLVTKPEFLEETVRTFRGMRPFFDYMSEVLTTDANGQPLY